jgi:hypothetical protein
MKRLVATTILFLIAAGNSAAQSPNTSAGNSGKDKKAKAVVTNDNISPGSQDSASSAPAKDSEDASAKPASSASKGTITVPGLLEDATVDEAQAMLDAMKKDEEVLIARYDQLQQKLASADNPVRRQMYTESLSHRDETLARKRQQIEAIESAIQHAIDSGSTHGGNHASQ